MSSKAMKRPAAAVAGGVSKKPAVSEHASGCALVAAALRDSDLPKKVAAMLSDVVGKTLGTPASSRHPFQMTIVTMIGEALAAMDESMQAAITDARAKVNGADEDKRIRDKAVSDAEAALASKTEVIRERQEALGAASAALDSAQEARKQAEAAKKSGDAAVASAVEMKSALLVAQAESAKLKTEAASAADSKAFLGRLKKFGFETGLLASLPEVLKKPPAERGTFDALIFGQLEGALVKALDGLVTESFCEASQASRAEALEAATAALATASEAKTAAASEHTNATAEAKEAAAALKEAKAHAKAFVQDMKVAATGLDDALKALQTFQDGALAAFNALKDDAPVPEAEAAHEAEGDTMPAPLPTAKAGEPAPAVGEGAEAAALVGAA